MRHAFRIKNMSLPYGNLITWILRLHKRDIPQANRVESKNLLNELSNIVWLWMD
jgi:hypothetical protein